ncbi:macrophage mannose receptor 1-like, partial [Huso huso]
LNQFLKVLHLLFFFFFLALCAVASGHFRKYHFVEDRKSWFDAQSYCRENHTDLATIESQEEADNLSKTRDNGKNEAWIGLYRDVKKNWQWSNSDAVIINNLEAAHDIIKKSDITKESCVKVENHGKWTNEHCSEKNSFMCYKGKPDKCSNASERYILIEESKTWYEAQQYCRENHTDLVSIKCDTEKEKIKNITKDGDKAFWIGLFNNPWKWSDGGDLDFQNWNSGKLSGDENEKCVFIELNERTWKDEKCDTKLPFFCYDANLSQAQYTFFSGICAVASGHFRKYHFVKDEKSWFDAQSYCREKHTDLATIESQAETEKLNISAGLTNAWIGLYYDKENWQWSNGDNVSYYNWTSSLSCTSVDSNGEWVDSDCNNVKYSFICYNETRESYILIDQPKTWYEAQQYCRTNYTDLVSIKNNDADKKIKKKANGKTVWIGLFNNPWKWSHKGEYSSFRNWDKGEPNSVGNNICVEMYGKRDKERGKWNDAGCHFASPFFCYNGKGPSVFSHHL